jgi:hypothetical protein
LWLLRARLRRHRWGFGTDRLLCRREFSERVRQGRCWRCGCCPFFRASSADDTREIAFGCELELLQAVFDKRLQHQASGVLGDERNPHLGFHAEAQVRVAIDRLEHVLAAKRLQRAAGLAKLDALVRDQRRPLNRLQGHPPKVSAVVHGQRVGLALDQVGGQPQPGDPRLAVQVADHLEHLLDGGADNAMPFNADHGT